MYAGTAAFAVYARTRVGDLAKIATEPSLDDAMCDGSGFVETGMLSHKTAKPGTKRALMVTSPITGVTGEPWGGNLASSSPHVWA